MRLIDDNKGLISKIQLETGCNFITAQKIVDSMPTVEERKVGKWIRYEKEFTESDTHRQIKRPVIECSICLEKIAGHIGIMNYCPNCGAEMRDTDNG